jgi:hypothetical protein
MISICQIQGQRLVGNVISQSFLAALGRGPLFFAKQRLHVSYVYEIVLKSCIVILFQSINPMLLAHLYCVDVNTVRLAAAICVFVLFQGTTFFCSSGWPHKLLFFFCKFANCFRRDVVHDCQVKCNFRTAAVLPENCKFFCIQCPAFDRVFVSDLTWSLLSRRNLTVALKLWVTLLYEQDCLIK